MAQKAFRMAPAFAPAGALAARLLVGEGKAERAAAILEEAWENGPHPALGARLSRHRAGRDAAKRAPSGCARSPRSAAIIASRRSCWRNWRWSAAIGAAAQAALEDAYRENPSSRICILFAQVARGRGDENAARTWLAQAAAAPREADWSDLDPEGPAFLYDDNDWARLVYVFGDGGQLVHPRMERGQQRCAGAGAGAADGGADAAEAGAARAQPAPDDVEVEEVR